MEVMWKIMLMIISVMITVGVERVRIGVRPIATIVIDMRFALKTRVVPVDHVLGGGADPPRGRGNFGGCFLIENPLYQRQRQKHVG